jgi:hypothetical protein
VLALGDLAAPRRLLIRLHFLLTGHLFFWTIAGIAIPLFLRWMSDLQRRDRVAVS